MSVDKSLDQNRWNELQAVRKDIQNNLLERDTLKTKKRLASLISENLKDEEKIRQLEELDKSTPDQVLIKTADFYNIFYKKQNFSGEEFGIKTKKDASNGLYSLEIEGEVPKNISEWIKNNPDEGKGKLAWNLFLSLAEESKDPMILSDQIMDTIERFIEWKNKQKNTQETPETNN